jgi:nucleotidyltransferase substrate binding protein (TIGR01987 family)
MSKYIAVKNQFEKALKRLEMALNAPKNEFVRDSAIQRFEFTLDLSWKMLKAYIEESKGIICHSPKDCFREAYRQKIIQYDDRWIHLVDLRNETVHTYNEDLAEMIYKELPEALILFKSLLLPLSL